MKSEGKKASGVKKNVFYMGLVSFFTDTSSEMIFPILPLFLTNVLGVSKSIIGLIEAVAESSASILKLFSGWLSDKMAMRKPLVLFGYSLSNFTKPFLSIVTSWLGVFSVRFLDRVGKGMRTAPRDALIAISSHQKQRGRSFGFHRMMDTAGAVVGAFLAWWLLSLLKDGYRTIFLLTAVPGAIAVIIVIFLVKDVKAAESNPGPPAKLRLMSFDKRFRQFIIISLIFNLGNFSYAFFILRAQDMGVRVAIIPLVYLLYNLIYVISALPAGILSDKVGRSSVLGLGFFAFFLLCLGFALFSGVIMVLLLFGLYGIFQAITETVSRAFISDLVPVQRKGTALGIYHTTTGLAAFPASLIAGTLWDRFSFQVPFFFSATIAMVALALLTVWLRPRSKLQEVLERGEH